MEYHLNRKIKLSEESEYKALYSWSLQELDEDGEEIGSKQIPWAWDQYFTAIELRHSHSIGFKKESDDEDEISFEDKDDDYIYAILHPGVYKDGQWHKDTSLSMLGTDRTMDKFVLKITKASEDSDEYCYVAGGVRYTAEIDYRDETLDDFLEIHLSIKPKQFCQILEQLKSPQMDSFQVCLGGVSGFYSEWSPSVSTRKIKILAGRSSQDVQIPEGCIIKPPKLGDVREFTLTVTERHKLDPEQDLKPVDVDKVFEDSDDYEEDFTQEYQDPKVDELELLLAQLATNEVVFKKLSTPVWLIFIVLCVYVVTVLF